MDQLSEKVRGNDSLAIVKTVVIPHDAPGIHDYAGWKSEWIVEKRPTGVVEWVEKRMPSALISCTSIPAEITGVDARSDFLKKNNHGYAAAFTELRREFELAVQPTEKVIAEGNMLVNAGMDLIWDAVMGTAITAFSNANAYLGVGDSSTAAAASQTDLQASSNKTRKAMNATYPDQPANSQIRFQSDFGSSDANYQWLEVATFNASSSGTMLNRLVPGGGLGTKASGATWTLTLTITLS